MTQLIELPPADTGLGPPRHSGPVFGYVREGRILTRWVPTVETIAYAQRGRGERQ
jgi:hypothetical protein